MTLRVCVCWVNKGQVKIGLSFDCARVDPMLEEFWCDKEWSWVCYCKITNK
jgi:hypothetical protein